MIQNIRPGKILFFILFFLYVFSPLLKAEELTYSVISEGYLTSDSLSQSMVIKEKEVLNKILVEQGIKDNSEEVDFNTETIALIVPEQGSYPDKINITEIDKSNQDIISVKFSVDSIAYVPEEDAEIKKPYKLIKITPAGKEYTSVSFRKVNSKRPVFVNNSVENLVGYSNILEDNRGNLFINYLPLDKGNSWTYDFTSSRGKGSQTFSIVTYTNGWSLFDSFFGMNNLALRLDRNGHIFVSSDKGNRPFYTNDVLVSYPGEPYKSEAGEFKDILVVSSNSDSKIKFKDVYAKDVGLIYHEHESDAGSAKYSLSSAYVRGKQIP